MRRHRPPLLRWGAGRRFLAAGIVFLSLGSLAESHPASSLHDNLPTADWVFPEARHGGAAPHVEGAGVPDRAECPGCLHGLRSGGAALRALAGVGSDQTVGAYHAPATAPPRGQHSHPRSSRAPPVS